MIGQKAKAINHQPPGIGGRPGGKRQLSQSLPSLGEPAAVYGYPCSTSRVVHLRAERSFAASKPVDDGLWNQGERPRRAERFPRPLQSDRERGSLQGKGQPETETAL